jgi:hypothetical protein
MSAPDSASLPQDVLDANRRVLDEIRELVQQQRLVPFVGAGMSNPIYPLWQELLVDFIRDRHWRDQYGRATANQLIREFKFEKAASLLNHEFEESFTATIYERLGNHRIKRRQNCLNTMPVRLLPKLFTGLVITTNFDRVLEWVYGGESEPVLPPFDGRPGQWRALARRRHDHLIKMHGCVSEERDIVFTEESYDEFYGADLQGESANFIREVLEAQEVLFLGCGLRQDRTLDLIASSTRAGPTSRYAVVEAPKRSDSPDLRSRQIELEKVGIRCYWYPHGHHDEVENVLLYLSGKGPSPTDDHPPSDVDNTTSPSP